MTQADYMSKREQLLSDLRHAHELQDRAFEAWCAIRPIGSAEFEAAENAYIEANAEVNRIIAKWNDFRNILPLLEQ
jgi:hypothetical protein